MVKVCAVMGKKPSTGNKVSHSNIKTKRRFLPNLMKKTFHDPETGKAFRVLISAKGIKTVTKNPRKLLDLARANRNN
jgi:large subunit ribosomal protein L28